MNTLPEIGAIVQLNSGGPALTVKAHGSRNGVFVVWINQNGESQETSFPMECVKPYVSILDHD